MNTKDILSLQLVMVVCLFHLEAKKTNSSSILKQLGEITYSLELVSYTICLLLIRNIYILELHSKLHFSPMFKVEVLFVHQDHKYNPSAELDLQLPPHLGPGLEIKYIL